MSMLSQHSITLCQFEIQSLKCDSHHSMRRFSRRSTWNWYKARNDQKARRTFRKLNLDLPYDAFDDYGNQIQKTERIRNGMIFFWWNEINIQSNTKNSKNWKNYFFRPNLTKCSRKFAKIGANPFIIKFRIKFFWHLTDRIPKKDDFWLVGWIHLHRLNALF